MLSRGASFRYPVTFILTWLRSGKENVPRKGCYGVSYRLSDYRPETGSTFWAERTALGFEACQSKRFEVKMTFQMRGGVHATVGLALGKCPRIPEWYNLTIKTD